MAITHIVHLWTAERFTWLCDFSWTECPRQHYQHILDVCKHVCECERERDERQGEDWENEYVAIAFCFSSCRRGGPRLCQAYNCDIWYQQPTLLKSTPFCLNTQQVPKSNSFLCPTSALLARLAHNRHQPDGTELTDYISAQAWFFGYFR